MKALRGFLALSFVIATVLGVILTLIVGIEKDPWIWLPVGTGLCGLIAYFLGEERTA